MKRPLTSPQAAAPSIPRRQLSLPFNADAAPEIEVGSRSRRALRREAAAREVRLAPTLEQTTDQMAAALALYLPPGKTLELRLTNNHYSMISVRRKSDGYRLRLHRMFVGAEPRIVRALARYVVHNDRRASTLLGEYIEQHQHIIRQQERRPRHLNVRTAGRHHDLQAIFDRLNDERFEGALEARITWGPVASRGRGRRSIKMGSFAVEDRVIRIHPALDQAVRPRLLRGVDRLPRDAARQARGPAQERPPPLPHAGVPRRGAPVLRLRPRLRLGEAEPRSAAPVVASSGLLLAFGEVPRYQ